jgi:uncharacterized Fe-S cluster protein YjdI
MPKLQVYAGDGFEVTYDAATCTHAGECVRGLPAVFDSKATPWIQPAAAPFDRIAEVVARCPSGALAIRRTGSAVAGPATSSQPSAAGAPAALIVCAADGPLLLEGPIVVRDAAGAVVASGGKVALCRCGQSGKKPFCDGAHRRAGFKG